MMGTEGLSAGDILALTKDNDNGMSGAWNNPFIYLVWLALLGGNGGLFGNRNADAAVQGALTRSDLFEGFNNQDVNSQLRGITNGVCDGFYAINSGMKDGFYGNQAAIKDGFYSTQSAIADSRYAMQDCCCRTNQNIRELSSEGYKNTCEITTAIHAEGEATRANQRKYNARPSRQTSRPRPRPNECAVPAFSTDSERHSYWDITSISTARLYYLQPLSVSRWHLRF